MSNWNSALLVAILGGLLAGGRACPQDALVQDARMLQEAGIPSDGPALLDFFRQRTLTDADRAQIATCIKDLASDDFQAREQATEKLTSLRSAAVPALKQAEKDADPEVVLRVRRCLQAVHGQVFDRQVPAAAARLLSQREPSRAVEVLLAYLPSAGDETLEDDLVGILAGLGVREGKLHGVLAAAASDPLPVRRLPAAACLARMAGPDRDTFRRLLEDPDGRVGFVAARALLESRDKSAVPRLLALLADGPFPLAVRSEELLARLAGEKRPTLSLGTGNPADRQQCQLAWTAWWQENRHVIDPGVLAAESSFLNLTVICDCGGDKGRVWECGPDGKLRWQIDGLGSPVDAHILPGGRVLVAEYMDRRVTERDRLGKVLWETQLAGRPLCCQRLPDGNTFIATENELLEVSAGGKTVYSFPQASRICSAQKQRDGHIFCIHGSGQISEIDAAGKEVQTIQVPAEKWADLEVLSGGRFLVAQYMADRVVEIDVSGKVFWECRVARPASASRLKNGNTLVASMEGGVIEFDQSGKEVWKQAAPDKPFRARRH